MYEILDNHRNLATGPDGKFGIFYERMAHKLSFPLTLIFQQSIHQRSVPDMWRLAIFQLLYNGNGDRSCAVSYSPISLIDLRVNV